MKTETILKKRMEDKNVKEKLYFGYGLVIVMMGIVAFFSLFAIFNLRIALKAISMMWIRCIMR